ncbi:MAG: hypothetical protein H0Z32_12170 [Bacillaceae bacterium]|nr:hypothetical protein [Bacillaceae bacterium]
MKNRTISVLLSTTLLMTPVTVFADDTGMKVSTEQQVHLDGQVETDLHENNVQLNISSKVEANTSVTSNLSNQNQNGNSDSSSQQVQLEESGKVKGEVTTETEDTVTAESQTTANMQASNQTSAETNAQSKTEAQSDPVNPDSFLYTLKRLFEKVKLLLTFDSESKLDLHLSLANERLSELQSLGTEKATEYFTKLYADYATNMEKATELLVKLKAENENIQESLDQLTSAAEKGKALLTDHADYISADLNERLALQTQLLQEMPSVLADLDQDIIAKLKAEGLAYGEIAQLSSIAELVNVTISELQTQLKDHDNLVKAAKELGLTSVSLLQNGDTAVKGDASLNANTSAEAETDNGTSVKANGNSVLDIILGN